MTQTTKIAYTPDPNSEKNLGYGNIKYNPIPDGLGMDVLLDYIERAVPYSENEKTHTTKEILRVERYECPCCPTTLTAIVDVNFTGYVSKEDEETAGFYKVHIGDTKNTVEKLESTLLHEEPSEGLPRKLKEE
jgi:hypothetical protein